MQICKLKSLNYIMKCFFFNSGKLMWCSLICIRKKCIYNYIYIGKIIKYSRLTKEPEVADLHQSTAKGLSVHIAKQMQFLIKFSSKIKSSKFNSQKWRNFLASNTLLKIIIHYFQDFNRLHILGILSGGQGTHRKLPFKCRADYRIL